MEEGRSGERFKVDVAYALAERQVVVPLEVEPGTTLQQAIERSGILDQFPEIDLTTAKVGVYGRLGKLDQELHPRDRVEIYRPLIADPKEVRRKRAAEGAGAKKSRSEGGGE